MFGAGSEWTWLADLQSSAAVLLTAFAVKMMDDFMDLRTDIHLGIPSVAERLGDATLPYALVLLALAALFDADTAGSLFAASYAVGMAFDLNRVLPSGLYGWQEAGGVLLLGMLLAGPTVQLWALLTIGFVQAVDDIADMRSDAFTGAANLVRRFGTGEVHMAALALLLAAAYLRPFLTVVVIVAVFAVEVTILRLLMYRQRTGVGIGYRGWAE